jgi:diacylglycerol O-acyltransferase / wax synthase
MVKPRRLDRLTASDLWALWADDFGWSEDIGVLAILDGTRLRDDAGRFGIEAVRRAIEPKLHLVPRFRQLLYRPGWGLGWPLWVDAPSFDLADHVRVRPLPAPGDEVQLLAACAELYRRRLDPSRPRWEAWLLPGLPAGRVGLLLRAHHTMVDGVAGVAAFAALLDGAADTPVAAVPPWTPARLPSAGELLADNLRGRLRGLGRGLSGLTRVGRSGSRRGSGGGLGEFFAERAPRTSLNRRVGAGRRFAVVRTGLEAARQVAHAHHATINDVVLAAVAGGLRALLSGRGEDVQALTLRATVPISLHREQPGQATGNQVAAMVVSLPLGEPDPGRRLELIAADTAARKRKTRAPVGTDILMRFVAVQRACYRFMAHQRSANLWVTNIPGPPVPLYLAGARVLELFPVVSLLGNLTLSVAVLSYTGQLTLTAVADQDTCPDVEVFAAGVRNTLDTLSRPLLAPSS